MKFLHLADLHIGKRVHGFSMLDDQRAILRQICALAAEQGVDAVLISGDVYDKTIPVCEAVGLFDSFLTSLREMDIRVLVIGGNHDSPERLDFASRLLEKQGVSIAGVFCSPLSCITMWDEYGAVHFWLFPFVRSAVVAGAMELEEHTSQCAVQRVLEQQKICTEERNVLLAHVFAVTGGSLPEQSDSEVIPVGGLDTVDTEVFDAFDYVALGHLHRAQRVGRDTVRYAGSPLSYSFSEARFPKSVSLVTMRDKGDIEVQLLPLTPPHAMRELRGRLEDMVSELVVRSGDPEDYLHITLTDEEELFDAVGTLTRVYPNLMKLDFDNAKTRVCAVSEPEEAVRALSVTEQFSAFFAQINGKEMNDQQREWIAALCEEEEIHEAD